MFHHGLSSQKDNKRQKGVAIILSPEFTKAYHDSWSVPPIIPVNEDNELFGRFICLKFNINVVRKEKKRELSGKILKRISHQI